MTSAGRVWRTGRPARVDDYTGATGELADRVKALGIHAAVAAPVHVGGRLWGAMIVSSVKPEPFPPGSEHRIGDFAQLVSQALSNAEARRDLAASRARLVEAADTERRRLERNLHDGAQQRLVALAVALRLVERRLDTDPEAARAGLHEAVAELQLSLAELRELARGIHPAVLTERGLAVALEGLAARCNLPVNLEVRLDGRLPEPVEAAAYYVVAEALANVAKYARASVADVTVEHDDGGLRVAVTDDGVGGATPSGGSGLRGLSDRVAALGGELDLASPSGRGTTVRASIPIRP
jgi:signal transduction histidine kinase